MTSSKESACTFLSDQALRSLLKELPTPFYLYDEAGLRRTARELNSAFGWNSGFRQHFPIRCCPSPGILRILAEENCGVYCKNAAELDLARRCGFSEDRILCAAFAGSETYMTILDGAFDQPPVPPKQVLLRINPGGKLTYGGQFFASLDRICLGMPTEAALTLARQFRLFGAQQLGLSFQALTNDPRTGYCLAAAQLLFEAACTFANTLGFAPDICCLGDCIASSDRPGLPEPSICECGVQLRSLYEQLLVPSGLGNVRLITTLGRRQVARHAVFVSRIRAVRERQRRLLLIDAACGQLADAGPMGCRHQIRVLGRHATGSEVTACDIAGRTSDPFGYLAMNCKLPAAAPGDALVFQTAGALPEDPVSEPAAQYLLREDGSVVSLDAQAEESSAR